MTAPNRTAEGIARGWAILRAETAAGRFVVDFVRRAHWCPHCDNYCGMVREHVEDCPIAAVLRARGGGR